MKDGNSPGALILSAKGVKAERLVRGALVIFQCRPTTGHLIMG